MLTASPVLTLPARLPAALPEPVPVPESVPVPAALPESVPVPEPAPVPAVGAASGTTCCTPRTAAASPVRAPADEEALCHRVDATDDQIIALIVQRAALVHEIQRNRAEAGRPTTRLARETQVIARYRGSLGRAGVDLALRLLNLCRYRGGRGSAEASQASCHS
ncbi:chorismate mutase [Streptomyces bambusae]|uniref:Chorismate mutase domain-containing protein n=1 Tax=Streptomyces bambusae TaxID=1550616 RepID=A0ABS6ZDA9_9ACTN|nr:chorismate mutase [Streptomyces bambusae]MBW5485755.1 hypothetical protein [Streptomyces bambusae]